MLIILTPKVWTLRGSVYFDLLCVKIVCRSFEERKGTYCVTRMIVEKCVYLPWRPPWIDLHEIWHSRSPRRPDQWSPVNFLAIGLGVLILWGVEFCYFPLFRLLPLTQYWLYRAACDEHFASWAFVRGIMSVLHHPGTICSHGPEGDDWYLPPDSWGGCRAGIQGGMPQAVCYIVLALVVWTAIVFFQCNSRLYLVVIRSLLWLFLLSQCILQEHGVKSWCPRSHMSEEAIYAVLFKAILHCSKSSIQWSLC